MQFWRASDASIRRKFRGIQRDAQVKTRVSRGWVCGAGAGAEVQCMIMVQHIKW